MSASLPRGHTREEFRKVHREGTSQRDATKIDGVCNRTTSDWDHGIRRVGVAQIYPDGGRMGYKKCDYYR